MAVADACPRDHEDEKVLAPLRREGLLSEHGTHLRVSHIALYHFEETHSEYVFVVPLTEWPVWLQKPREEFVAFCRSAALQGIAQAVARRRDGVCLQQRAVRVDDDHKGVVRRGRDAQYVVRAELNVGCVNTISSIAAPGDTGMRGQQSGHNSIKYLATYNEWIDVRVGCSVWRMC